MKQGRAPEVVQGLLQTLRGIENLWLHLRRFWRNRVNYSGLIPSSRNVSGSYDKTVRLWDAATGKQKSLDKKKAF